jgi:two-component system LytT family response regulator
VSGEDGSVADPLRVLIVDDEAFARQRLRRLLGSIEDVSLVGECGSGTDAVRAIHEDSPDVVLLDIRMPGIDGFGVLRDLPPERAPLIIFVTAHDEHAVRAFEVSAVDYVLKPAERDRLELALQRAREVRDRVSVAERYRRMMALVTELTSMPARAPSGAAVVAPKIITSESGAAHPDRLVIKENGRVILVRTADVDWIEARGNYARLHVGRAVHLLRETMGSLEQRLDPKRFARIHRSTIVNLDRVKEMQPWFSGEYVVLLLDGTKLKLSRW